MLANETAAQVLREPPFSISQLRAYTRCPRSYELQYLADPRYSAHDMGASVWFGSVMQKIIQYSYYDLPLYEAHLQVWQRECPEIFDVLERWLDLDEAYRESGKPNSNARKDWQKQHPEYQAQAEQIANYQREILTAWDWKKSYSLTGFYRWSSTFARTVPQDQVLLPHAVMVEGLPLYTSEGELMPLDDDGSGRKSYCVLHGVFGTQSEVHVIGVPDEFAVDEQGVAWICDNKVSASMLTPDELGEDAQLASYYVLLCQNDWIKPGQPTMVGHKYIQEDRVVPVWASTAHYDDWVLPQLHDQFSRLRSARMSGIFPRVRGIQPAAFSPCKYCGVAYACLNHRTTPQVVVDDLVLPSF